MKKKCWSCLVFVFLGLMVCGYGAGRVDGKVVVITGGSKGIGRGIAGVFAKEGAKVVISSRSQEDLERVAEEVRSEGGEIYVGCCGYY